MDILRIEHLSKIYGKGDTEVRALDDVSFTVKKGEALGIIGHNGAGKSTLLKLLVRLRQKQPAAYSGRCGYAYGWACVCGRNGYYHLGRDGAGYLPPPPNRSDLSVLQFDSHFDRRGKYDAALAAG